MISEPLFKKKNKVYPNELSCTFCSTRYLGPPSDHPLKFHARDEYTSA